MPSFIQGAYRNPYTVDEFIEEFCSGDFEFEPGAKYTYSNSGYFLLGAIIEKVTGKSYEEALQERICGPLGMKNTGYDHHSMIISKRATGYEKFGTDYENSPYLDMSLPFSAGAMYSTVEDLYLWDQALYTDQLLSQEMRDLMFTSHVKASGGGYGYGWRISKRALKGTKEKLKLIYHGGGINGFSTLIDRLVVSRHLIVLMNNTGGTDLSLMSTAITNILYDKPYDLPKKSIATVLYETLETKGAKAAFDQYKDYKMKFPKKYNFSPTELINLGYNLLLIKNQADDAIEIFKIVTEVHPKNFMGFSVLGQAYRKKGDRLKAIENYAKSLALNPQNNDALKALKELSEED